MEVPQLTQARHGPSDVTALTHHNSHHPATCAVRWPEGTSLIYRPWEILYFVNWILTVVNVLFFNNWQSCHAFITIFWVIICPGDFAWFQIFLYSILWIRFVIIACYAAEEYQVIIVTSLLFAHVGVLGCGSLRNVDEM